MSRLACFLVPLFPLAARLRSEPELTGEAVAVVEGNGGAAHVIAATRRARKGGIRPGLSLPQARAILPKLIARSRDMECERAAQEALLDLAEGFSPRVEDAGDGMVYLDLDGLERLWRPENGRSADENLAQAAMQLATSHRLPLRIGIASSKLAARVAAEIPQTPTIVPVGNEAEFLSPLPLLRLSPEMEIAGMLSRWGIDSIGQLARLPEAEVASRLGEVGRDLHYAARGVDPRPLVPRQTPPFFREGMDLEWPLVTLEPFLFVAHAALDRLATRLETHGFACKRLEVSLRLEPDGFHDRGIELPAPTRDVKTMLTLVRLDLEATPPGGPVAGFSLTAHPDKPRRAQLSLFGPPALSPDRLSTTIARIASMVGRERIGTPATIDGYRPERYALREYDPPPPPELKRAPRKGRGLLAVRVLRPPLPLDVITEGEEIDPPSARLRLLSLRLAAEHPLKIDGSIKVSSGPWRLEEAWWSETPVERDYWDVELVNGGIYRLFRERHSGGWFVDGVYD